MSSIDDIVGVKPLAYRLAESLHMASMDSAAYRDGKPAETVQADDTALRILIPQGLLSIFIKPKYAGLLRFEQGEREAAEWRLDVIDKLYVDAMTLLAKELGKRYGVTITPALLP